MTTIEGLALQTVEGILPLGGFSLGCLQKSPRHPGVLLGEVSSSAVSVSSAQLIQVTGEGTGGTSRKKENIFIGVIGRGGGREGAGGGDNRQVLSSRGFWLLPART